MNLHFRMTFLLGALVSFQAFSLDCLGRYSIGEQILDKNERVGKVVGCDEGEILYKVGSYSYEAKHADLYKVNPNGYGMIKVGQSVINEYHNIYNVVQTFEENYVYIERNGSKDVKKVTELAYLIPEGIGKVKKGIEVIDDFNNVRVVVAVYSNNEVYTDRNGSKSWFQLSELTLEKKSNFGRIKPKQTVIDQFDNIRTVEKIYTDGRVQTDRNGSKSWLGEDELFPLVPGGIGNMVKDLVVIDQFDNIRTIKAVFSNKRIQTDRNGSISWFNVGELTPRKTQGFGNIKVGTIVIDQFDSVHKVVDFFENDRVKTERKGSISWFDVSELDYLLPQGIENFSKGVVVIDEFENVREVGQVFSNHRIQTFRKGSVSWFDAEDLSYEIKEGVGEYKKGVNVLNYHGYVGKINYIFSNNSAVVSRNGSTDAYPIKDLAYEVELGSDYTKGATYASDEFDIGELEMQFSNGGYALKHGNKLYGANKLFEKAESFDNFIVGDSIIDSYERTSKIESIFANGVIQYKFHSKLHKKNILGRGVIYSEKQDQEVLEKLNYEFIKCIKAKIVDKNDYYFGAVYPVYAQQAEDWTFKSVAGFYNKKSNEFFHSKKAKAKIRQYLDEGRSGDGPSEGPAGSEIYVSLNNSEFQQIVTEAISEKFYRKAVFVEDGSEELKITVKYPTRKKRGCSIQVLHSTGGMAITITRENSLAKKNKCQKTLSKIIISELDL